MPQAYNLDQPKLGMLSCDELHHGLHWMLDGSLLLCRQTCLTESRHSIHDTYIMAVHEASLQGLI